MLRIVVRYSSTTEVIALLLRQVSLLFYKVLCNVFFLGPILVQKTSSFCEARTKRFWS